MPSPEPAKLEQLQQKLAIELTRAKIEKLRSVRVASNPKPKRFRTRLFEWLFRGGALIAVLAMAAGYIGNREGGATARHIAACERANAAITDDAYNRLLTDAEARRFELQQLQIAERCNRDVEL
jgi:hypothetical protein